MADVTLERPTVCDRCQAALVERTVTHEILIGAERFDIDNVPALECPQCGQRWISDETQEVLDRIVRENQAP
jgi:YgiT-type zinc finger domain-containing protein